MRRPCSNRRRIIASSLIRSMNFIVASVTLVIFAISIIVGGSGWR
jgi:hypothetical protein